MTVPQSTGDPEPHRASAGRPGGSGAGEQELRRENRHEKPGNHPPPRMAYFYAVRKRRLTKRDPARP